MIFHVANFLTGLVEALILFRLYDVFCGKNPQQSSGIYVLGILGLTLAINVSNIVFDYGILNAVAMNVEFLCASFLFQGKPSVKLIIAVLTFAMIGVVEIIVLFGITLIYGITVATVMQTPLYRLLGIIVSKTLTLFLANVIYIKVKKKPFYIGTSYWFLFLFMFSTSIVTAFLMFKLSLDGNSTEMNNLSVLCSFGLLFSTFFAMYLYEHLAKQAETIKNQEQYQQHLRAQLKHLDEITLAQKQLKKFKHDFTNCTIGLQAYMEGGDMQEAKNCLTRLANDFYQGGVILETGNTALDAILSTKIAVAKNKGINVDTKIQIPESLYVEPLDLCVIFGNALDNAIEACLRSNIREKYIGITIVCRDRALLCKIVNTAPMSLGDLKRTTKADKANHGFGLENMRNALKKYHAEPEISQTETEFELRFVLFPQ